MKRIEVLDKAIADRIRDVRAIGINPTLLGAYKTSLRVENEKINFEEVIWDDEIKDIAAELKSYGVCEFTISSNYSGLIKALAAFQKYGFQMAGITEVNAGYRNAFTEDYERIPAIRMMNI